MTINTDISSTKLTKISKYMFFIEMSLYFPLTVQEAFQKLEPNLKEDFNSLNVYIDDENVKDYSIHEELKSDKPSFVYFIKCDTRNPRFKTQLEIIKNYSGFVDCYQYYNSQSDVAIIRCKISVKHRMMKLVDSKYSEMYSEQEYHSIGKNSSIQNIYSRYNYSTNKQEFDRSFHVLLHSEELLNKLVSDLNLTDSKTIETLSNNEFDGKYSIMNETITFKNYNSDN